MVYYVSTNKRTYNSVQNKKTFQTTRKLRKDNTKVNDVFRWSKTKQKWIRVNKQGW